MNEEKLVRLMCDQFRQDATSIAVTKKCCHECLFWPHKIFTDEQRDQVIAEMLDEQMTWECHVVTIAERRGVAVPRYSVCYGYFYMYHDRIVALREALEDGRIVFLDIEGWPGIAETGLCLYGNPPWQRVPVGIRISKED